MTELHRAAAAGLVLAAFATTAAWAQALPSSPGPRNINSGLAPVGTPGPITPSPTPGPNRRSVVYRHPSRYQLERAAAYQNPGGVGRYSEYYAPGVPLQAERDPVQVATFGGGGVPSRAEQMQAQALGIQRYNSIQQHIDNYAAPRFGYGMGVGMFGGFN